MVCGNLNETIEMVDEFVRSGLDVALESGHQLGVGVGGIGVGGIGTVVALDVLSEHQIGLAQDLLANESVVVVDVMADHQMDLIEDEMAGTLDFEHTTPDRTVIRQAFTHRRKLEILARYDAVGSIRKTAKEFGISRRQLARWIRMRDFLAGDEVQLERSRMDGGGRKVTHPALETKLAAYVKRQRAEKFIVTYSMMQEKATEFAKQLGITNFKASVGYVQKFCLRNGLT